MPRMSPRPAEISDNYTIIQRLINQEQSWTPPLTRAQQSVLCSSHKQPAVPQFCLPKMPVLVGNDASWK